MLTLTDSEKRMLDGRDGKARQKAMELLVRYADALGAERFVDTRNVAGVPGSANPFLQNYYKDKGAPGFDAIFSYFDLDADELIEVPQAVVPTYHLQGGADPTGWQTLGVKVEVFRNYEEREAFAARHDVGILKTCTPYLAGNVPAKGEHLVDGIVRGDLRQLRPRRAHQHRRAREHQRGDADRKDSGLGSAPD